MTAFTVWKFSTVDGAEHGAAWGAFWGLLVGTLATIHVLGPAAAAGLGALARATKGLGIDEEQLATIGREIYMQLVRTNLTEAEKAMLREAFES